jgi:hypothetical protein
LIVNASTERTPSKDNTIAHGKTTVKPTLGSITPPTGTCDTASLGGVIAGPPGSVTVPPAEAVKVNVIIIRVESSDADGN